MNIFKKLFGLGSTSTLNILGAVVATGFLTISTLAFTGVIQIFDSQITVTFVNYDNQVLDVVQANRGDDVEYRGDTPTRPASGANIYVFSGWSESLQNVRTDLEVKALFNAFTNSFEAKFYNQDQQIYSTVVSYGSALVYGGPTPTYPNDSRFNYEFIGWDITADGVVDPLPSSVTENITARAIFVARLNSFLVRFRNHDRQILSEQTFYYGDKGAYLGKQPFKLPERGKHFVFEGWLPSIDFIMADMDVIAQFDDGGGVPFIAENKNWQIGDTQLFGEDQLPINSEDFPDFLPYVGEDGNWWIGDINLELLAETFAESTAYPFINDLGNWQIGDFDTGIPFDLSNLEFPTLGENGNWFIGDIDTDIPAIIPSIGEDGDWMIGDYDTNILADAFSIEELGTPFVAPNGNWWIGQNDTGIPATGFGDFEFDLEAFSNIPFVGPNDNWWIGMVDTGIAVTETIEDFPYIGENDHWWIGDTDTYISAHGMEGDTPYPYVGENGNWFFGETDTNVPATLESLTTFTVSIDGNWWIGPVDTGIPAIVISVAMFGNWTINELDTGISFYDTSIIAPYIGENGNYFIGLIDTGISAYGDYDPETIVPEVPGGDTDTGEEEEYVEQILDTGEYDFGYDYTMIGGGSSGGSGGGSGGSTDGTTTPIGQQGLCPSNMTVTPIDIKVLDIEKKYDGQSISNDSALLEYDETILQEGERIVVTFENMGPQQDPNQMPTSIGRFELRGKLSILNAENEILKCVYQPRITEVGDLIITPRTLIINTSTVSKPEDGKPLTNSVYTLTGDGLVAGHTLQVTFTGEQTEVGTSVNTLDWTTLKVLDAAGVDVTKNYIITYNYGLLIVTFA